MGLKTYRVYRPQWEVTVTAENEREAMEYGAYSFDQRDTDMDDLHVEPAEGAARH